ncbi:MAG: hypothetical protein FJZ01_25560 [Candidatus Sericytochromatia bacterium]|nr:hypothetical protein [Candidatus Tanganyikabacteria bacterium]
MPRAPGGARQEAPRGLLAAFRAANDPGARGAPTQPPPGGSPGGIPGRATPTTSLFPAGSAGDRPKAPAPAARIARPSTDVPGARQGAPELRTTRILSGAERQGIRQALRVVDTTRQHFKVVLSLAERLADVVGSRPLGLVERKSLQTVVDAARKDLKTALGHVTAMEKAVAKKGSGMSPAEVTAARQALGSVAADIKGRLQSLEMVAKLLGGFGNKPIDAKGQETLARLLSSLGVGDAPAGPAGSGRSPAAERSGEPDAPASPTDSQRAPGEAPSGQDGAGSDASSGDGGQAENERLAAARRLDKEQLRAAQAREQEQEAQKAEGRKRDLEGREKDRLAPPRQMPPRSAEGAESPDEKVQAARFRFLRDLADRD